MNTPFIGPVPLINATPVRQIVLTFAPTGVVGEYQIQITYQGIPEGWPFVWNSLLDAAKAAVQEMVNQERLRQGSMFVHQGNGEKH